MIRAASVSGKASPEAFPATCVISPSPVAFRAARRARTLRRKLSDVGGSETSGRRTSRRHLLRLREASDGLRAPSRERATATLPVVLDPAVRVFEVGYPTALVARQASGVDAGVFGASLAA